MDHDSNIQELRTEWNSLQPLQPDREKRLWQKLRLEWNYHSNHIEGNTLTYGETELLLIHGQTHGNHTLREYEEMQAHDVGIIHLRELAADNTRPIREDDIRNLNKIILKEPFWKPTQTADGKPTRKQIIPGEYKTTPNNVVTATGQLFEFAPPSDVPARMQALVEWLGESLDHFRDADIFWILAKLHHDFVLIHPFDDGNGRVARMLVNYVLLRLGYPPIIVPTERKKDYLAALRLADAGDPGELEQFLASCLLRSLELGVRAGRGESIREPSDVEKQVTLFVREQQTRPEPDRPSQEMVEAVISTSLLPLIFSIQQKLASLKPLFARSHVVGVNGEGSFMNMPFDMSLAEELFVVSPRQQVSVNFTFDGYTGPSSGSFDMQTVIQLRFDGRSYVVLHDSEVILSRTYSEPVLQPEIEELSARVLSKVFANVRAKSGATSEWGSPPEI